MVILESHNFLSVETLYEYSINLLSIKFSNSLFPFEFKSSFFLFISLLYSFNFLLNPLLKLEITESKIILRGLNDFSKLFLKSLSSITADKIFLSSARFLIRLSLRNIFYTFS